MMKFTEKTLALNLDNNTLEVLIVNEEESIHEEIIIFLLDKFNKIKFSYLNK